MNDLSNLSFHNRAAADAKDPDYFVYQKSTKAGMAWENLFHAKKAIGWTYTHNNLTPATIAVKTWN